MSDQAAQHAPYKLPAANAQHAAIRQRLIHRNWNHHRYLTLKETAARIGISTMALQLRIRRCTSPIAAYRIGRGWHFRAADVAQYVADLEMERKRKR